MKRYAIDRYLRLISYLHEPNLMMNDSSTFFRLTAPGIDFISTYVEPFRKELAENILIKDSAEGKKDLMIFYIQEFIESADKIYAFMNIRSDENISHNAEIPKWYLDHEFTDETLEDHHEDVIYYIFILIFNEIQTYCILYNIPFREICDDLSFPLDTINLRFTLDNEEKNNLLTYKKRLEFNALPVIRPIFSSEYIPLIYVILKDFFPKAQQPALLRIFETGGNANKSLSFMDKGARLADMFKKLIEADIIKGCGKKELEIWIGQNFQYRHQTEMKKFTQRYLSDIISSKKIKCQKPILIVKDNKETGGLLITKQ
jgi:hypothetical protein